MGRVEYDNNSPRSAIHAYWPVAVLVVAWLAVMALRTPIRVKWWEMRLRGAVSDKQQLYYLNLLSSVGSSALPAARSLLGDSDPAIRSFGVGILTQIPDECTTTLLRSAIDDSENEVREMAIIGLAMRQDQIILTDLREMASSTNARQALAAVGAYASYDCEVASAPLCQIAREHPLVLLRVQAIEQLGYMRCTEAMPTLIDALADEEPYDGATLLEELDQRALDLLSQQRHEDDQPIRLRGFQAVSDQAAFSLRFITGQSFGFSSTDEPERRKAAQTAWRNWWFAQQRG